MLIVGAAYGVIGVGSANLDDTVWANGMRPWRLGAWLASAIVAAVHIGYEHHRLGSSPLRSAWHVAGAASLGGFGIALGANLHWLLSTATTRPELPPLLALALFPVVTGIPAFVGGLAVAAVVRHLSRRSRMA